MRADRKTRFFGRATATRTRCFADEQWSAVKDRLCECAGGSRETGDAIADTISAIYSDSVEWASAGCKFLRTGRTAQKVAPQIAALSHKLLRARERGWSVVLCADRRRGIVRIVTVGLPLGSTKRARWEKSA